LLEKLKGLLKKRDSVSDNIYLRATIIAFITFVVSGVLGALLPQTDEVTSQKILESLITLDGVLFGFTAVMIGFFLRESLKLTDKTMKRSLTLSLTAFLCFIFSIFLSFMGISLGLDYMEMPVLTPVFGTVFGAFCASANLILIFSDEHYPPKDS
jgi:uncharacterized protein YacL